MDSVSVSRCPFCPENGMVEIVADEGIGYLVKAKDSPIEDCYLIVPHSHIIDMTMLPDMWQVAVARLMSSVPWFSPNVTPYNLSLNSGEPAGQTVPHLHFWVIPRFESPRAASHRLGAATIIQRFNDTNT